MSRKRIKIRMGKLWKIEKSTFIFDPIILGTDLFETSQTYRL